MQIQNPSYYGIIPAEIRYDVRLKPNAKLLYSEITALSNKEGFCWASNSYFAKLYGVSVNTVSLWIAQLIDYGFISSEIVYKENSKQVEARYIRLCTYPSTQKKGDPITKNSDTPITKNDEDNTTSNNNKDNTSKAEPCTGNATLIPLVIKEMETIDPKNKRFYGNKTQREACDFLISEYGLDLVTQVIKAIPILKQKLPYMPSVTTPVELRDKWVKIKDAVQRNKAKEPEVIFT
jgi:hypothetical protein